LDPEDATIFRERAGVIVDELHADHLDVVAALFVKADGGPDQAGDAVQFLGRARLPTALAVRARDIRAVHHHREVDPIDLRLILDQRPDGLAYLIVGSFFLARVLRTGTLLLARIGVWQIVLH